MMRIEIKKMLASATLIVASFNCSQLHADFQGDKARARAATQAAIFAAKNVASLNKEIKSKRQQITRTERLFSELQKRKKQWLANIEKTKKQLDQAKNMLTSTQEKINQKTKTAQEKIQEMQPLVAELQQANMPKDIAAGEQAVQQFKKATSDVAEIFKVEQANLEKIGSALTALEGK